MENAQSKELEITHVLRGGDTEQIMQLQYLAYFEA